MTTLKQSTAQKIVFVLKDGLGAEVTGLGTAFVLAISKNGGAFGASAGTKAEVGSGWYAYTFTAAETDTAGPLAVKVTHASIDQTNLEYQVTASGWDAPAGTNILSVEEAANVLRCEQDDPNMLMLLTGIDAYLELATGRAWQDDSPIREEAKNAARMLLVMWHENPGMINVPTNGLQFGLRAVIMQLKALQLQLLTAGVPEYDLALVAVTPRNGASAVSVDVTPVLIFNNELAAGAVNQVSITGVTTTQTLDATGKILAVDPASTLAFSTTYTLLLDGVTDIYGQTLTQELQFTTED